MISTIHPSMLLHSAAAPVGAMLLWLFPFRGSRILVALASLFAGATVAVAQTNLPNARVGTAYSYFVTTTPAAPAGTVFGATGLPTGISINASSGQISGTPITAGTYNGTISLTEGGITDNFSVVLVVEPPLGTPVISSPTALSGTVGTPIATYTVTASNAPTSFNVGTLPAGLSLGGSATVPTISGTPTAAGTVAVSLSANNNTGAGAATTLTITIAPAGPVPAITSATSANVALNAAFTYTITASNSPVTFAAAGLPLGLSVNSATGAITGTPTVAGLYTVSLTATNNNGTSSATNLSLTVGAVSSITSAASASATVGSPFNFTLTGSNSPLSFNVTGLPPGLSVNSSSGAITGTPTTVGAFTLSVSANNATGTGPGSTLTLNVAAAPSGGGGGGGGGGGSGTATPVAPVIVSMTSSFSVVAGNPASFTVAVAGTGAPTYQWLKDGLAIAGATSATYTVPAAQASDAGNYSVIVTNSVGSTTSTAARLSVTALVTPPVITAQPAGQTASVGASVTFTVAATGNPAPTYQWRRNGTGIPGATGASLTLSNVQIADSGSYTVVVTNSQGTVTSTAAALTVVGPAFAGTYFGTFGNNQGSWALYVRPDNTGVFVGHLTATKNSIVLHPTLAANGSFTVAAAGSAAAPAAEGPARAASGHETPAFTLSGQITSGAVTGQLIGLGVALTGAAESATGPAQAIAGFYTAASLGSGAGATYVVVSASGRALVVTSTPTLSDAASGTISAAGALTTTTSGGAQLSLSLDGGQRSVGATLTPAGSSVPVLFSGLADGAASTSRLINLSVRSIAASGDQTLIVGFTLDGVGSKQTLVRGVGPTLTRFGVGNALANPQLRLFNQASLLVSQNDDWNGDAALSRAFVTVGAFALPVDSRDAALLPTLPAGSYTTQLSGVPATAGGVVPSGVALIEAYDADLAGTAVRLVNLSARAQVGTGENVLIVGFVVTGNAPSTLLIRGIGPTLALFGVSGALADPQLSVFDSRGAMLAQNNDWGGGASLGSAFGRAGAFGLAASSKDAAVVITVEPGAYTAHVSGVSATTGVGLIEIYDLR